MHEHGARDRKELVRFVAEHRSARRRHIAPLSVRPLEHDDVGRAVREQAIPRLALGQFFRIFDRPLRPIVEAPHLQQQEGRGGKRRKGRELENRGAIHTDHSGGEHDTADPSSGHDAKDENEGGGAAEGDQLGDGYGASTGPRPQARSVAQRLIGSNKEILDQHVSVLRRN
jgi:hypothetical protein